MNTDFKKLALFKTGYAKRWVLHIHLKKSYHKK
jgi:hypothetical protein